MTACPRCGSRQLVRSHDEVLCLVSCGTISSPIRAWENVATPPMAKNGQRAIENRNLFWTDEERHEHATWKEGDYVREPLDSWSILRSRKRFSK